MINAMLAEAQARVTTPKIQRIGSLTILSCTIAAAIAISQIAPKNNTAQPKPAPRELGSSDNLSL